MMLTAKEVSAELRLSRSATYELMRRMEHVQLGGRIRVTREALDAFIAANTRTPAPAAGAFTPARPQRPRPVRPTATATDGPVPKWRQRPIVPRTKPRVSA